MEKKRAIIFLGLMALGVLSGWAQQRGSSTQIRQMGSLFPVFLEENMFRYPNRIRGWGYLDSAGNVIVPAQFSSAGHFSEGLAPVREGPLPVRFTSKPSIITRKWGYINDAGKMAIEPQFDTAGIFSEGLAWIEIDGKFGFIDKSGKIVVIPQFDEARNFSGGFALVRVNNKYGYINPSGQLVIAPRFEAANSFSEGLAAVKVGTHYGYIDHIGRLAIEPRFDGAVSFSAGLAKVNVHSKWGYINRVGTLIIQPQFEECGSFAEGLAEVKIGANWGYVDPTGKIIIKPQFSEADSFSEGLASVKIKDRWGYINKLGNIEITPQYLSAKPFYKGIGIVTQLKSGIPPGVIVYFETWAYINTKGTVLAEQTRHVDNVGASEFGAFYYEVEISLNSRPAGAIVYLVPLYDWENDPDIMNDDRRLSRYRVAQGNTNVKTKQPEKVFKAIFVLNDRRIAIDVDVIAQGNDSFRVEFQ